MKRSLFYRKIVSEERDRRFLDQFGKKMGYLKEEDWYLLKQKNIPQRELPRFKSLLANYEKSFAKLLNATYPHHQWYTWRFESVPKRFWEVKENQKAFLDSLRHKLGHKTMQDWYKITYLEITQHGGSALLGMHKGSPSKLILSVYPDQGLLRWRFDGIQKGYWDSLDNRKNYLDCLGIELGIIHREDWYQVSLKSFLERGGCSLLAKYGFSKIEVLKSTYSNHEWNQGEESWTLSDNNKREFIDWLGEDLGFKQMEDWYRVSAKEITERGGNSLLEMYNGFPSQLVMSIYSEHAWLPWKFSRSGFEGNQMVEIIRFLEKELKITSPKEWYRISWTQVSEKVSIALFNSFSLEKFLQETYPQHKWKISQLPKRWNVTKRKRRIPKDLEQSQQKSSSISFPN